MLFSCQALTGGTREKRSEAAKLLRSVDWEANGNIG